MCIHLEKILLYACINYSNNTINILPCYVIDDVRRAMFITVVMRYTLTSADRDVICQVEIKSTRERSSESLVSSLFYFILFFFCIRGDDSIVVVGVSFDSNSFDWSNIEFGVTIYSVSFRFFFLFVLSTWFKLELYAV